MRVTLRWNDSRVGKRHVKMGSMGSFLMGHVLVFICTSKRVVRMRWWIGVWGEEGSRPGGVCGVLAF